MKSNLGNLGAMASDNAEFQLQTELDKMLLSWEGSLNFPQYFCKKSKVPSSAKLSLQIQYTNVPLNTQISQESLSS